MADLDEKAKRVRELLNSFYKSDESDSVDDAGLGAGVSAVRRDTLLQINTRAFDPERYMASLVRKTNLSNLLKKNVEMAAEIKNLDSDMQMLVYENYNKFISATEPIRMMKEDFSGMESNMQQLLEKVTAVRAKIDGINGSLFERRERIEVLNGTRSLIRKVQFVVELPKRLRECLKADQYADVVGFYVGALPVLKAYGNSSFKTCKEECEKVMTLVSQDLQARVVADSEPLERRAEAVALLQRLEYPVEQLMEGFLSTSMERLLPQVAAADFKSNSNEKSFITEFARSVTVFRSIFSMGEERLVKAAQDILNKYYLSLQDSLHSENAHLSAKELVLFLRTLSGDVAKMHEIVPEANFPAWAAKVVEDAVKGHVEWVFASFYNQVTGTLSEIHSPTKPSSNDHKKPLLLALENVQNMIINGGLHVLKELSGLLDESVDLLESCRDVYIDLVQGGFQHVFVSLGDNFYYLASKTASDNNDNTTTARSARPATAFILLLSRLSAFIEQEGVPKITEILGTSFRSGGSVGDCPAFNPSEICRAFRTASERLLHQYVEGQSHKLSVVIGKSMTTPNWLQYKEPRDVRMFVDVVLEEVRSVEGDVKEVLEAGVAKSYHRRSDSAGSASSTRSSTAGSGRDRLLERDVAKLFKQKVEIFTKPELTQAWVISTIVKMCVKSYQEYVEQQKFGRCGYQQIQVDTEYLRDPLKEFVDDPYVVDFLLDEVCAAAAERCTDPIPLEQAVLDKIIQTKRARHDSQHQHHSPPLLY